MLKSCITIRPGTIIGIAGEAYKVTGNETLDQIIRLRQIASPNLTKSIRYSAGQEIHVRWTPDTRI